MSDLDRSKSINSKPLKMFTVPCMICQQVHTMYVPYDVPILRFPVKPHHREECRLDDFESVW